MGKSKKRAAAPLATAPKPPKVSKAGRRLVTVDRVADGVITRTDHTVVGVVEVFGLPFDMLKPDEQDLILMQFRAMLHALTFPIAIHILNEQLDLSPEIGRFRQHTPATYHDVDPVHADRWAEIAQGYADVVSTYTGYIDRTVYWVVAPSASPSQALERARTLQSLLQPVHPDLNPFIPDRDRILGLLATAYGHPLPGAASLYAGPLDMDLSTGSSG